MIHTNTPATVAEGPQDCTDNKAADTSDKRKLPVAYEEVTLTEEAAAVLEKERKAAAERPPRKLRRVPTSPAR